MPHKPSPENLASISQSISRLLFHYWTANEPAEVRQAQIEDWVTDLAEFSPLAVERACERWRRGEEHRPTIARLRPIVGEEQGRFDYKALPRYDGVFPSFNDRDQLREIVRRQQYSQMDYEQQRRWHAYDYAFRRLVMGDGNAYGPLDPQGKHYHLDMVNEATAFHKQHGFVTR